MRIVPFCVTLLLSSYQVAAQSIGDSLVFPDVIENSSAVFATTITTEYADHSTAAFLLHNTRLSNGVMPERPSKYLPATE